MFYVEVHFLQMFISVYLCTFAEGASTKQFGIQVNCTGHE